MRRTLRAAPRLILPILIVQALVTAAVEGILQLREDAYLRAKLASWNLPADPMAKALAIRDHVRMEVTHVGLDVNAPRPLLRDSAQTTLETGRGFCGEKARVMIRMLRLEGLEAHRVYLWGGPTLQHVIAEVLVDGRPIGLEPLRGLPTETDEREIMARLGMPQRSYWSPRALLALGLDPFAVGSFWARTPPPGFVVTLGESPHAASLLAGLIELGCAGAAWAFVRRRVAAVRRSIADESLAATPSAQRA